MEKQGKDPLYELFAGMSDEALPLDFNQKVMQKVREAAMIVEKRHRYMEVLGYVSGVVVMIAVCVMVFYYFDISFEFPRWEFSSFPSLGRLNWSFSTPNFDLFHSPSFLISLHVGVVAIFLLIVDSSIRRKIEKDNK